MNNISDKVFKRIKENNIKPKSRYYFITKNYFIWSIFGISILIGSLAFSMILFISKQLDWDIYPYLKENFLKTILINLPYFWLLFFCLFIGIAYYHFIHTKKGYQFKFISILLISLVVSIILGTSLYFNGFSESLEGIFLEKIPYYKNLVYTREKQWMNPQKGLLAGIIAEVELSENSFILIDLENNRWKVDATEATWKGRLIPSLNLKIKLIGKIQENYNFKALEIRPWQGQRKFNKT